MRMCPIDAVGCSDTAVIGGVDLFVPFLVAAVVIAIIAYVLARHRRR